ncbi:hypothetical protein H5079_04385 [Pseudoalteromonas sp. SG44-5]|uniref:hypothetical protein n=1 Tax=Pseudoalteromonas sp. SG44-5 TaxID=2760960 RepID=UPI0015FA9C9A|nr:hypothetical protein [Pseudoalteromonas sp. SG44-5]MBB1404847.1 hypothetical protein [Pseudoalteromonas sp. SG44-5]
MGIKIYVASLSLIFFIILVFFFYQFNFNLNTPIENWVNTASYFNGILTPPLLAITSVLIFLTWRTSKSELEETKLALREQSDTQNFSVIKDAVFEIANEIKVTMQKEIRVFDDNKEIYFINFDGYKDSEIDEYYYEHSQKIPLEKFIFEYFQFLKTRPDKNIERNKQHVDIIFSKETFEYIDKIKSIALFMRALKSKEYREVLEVTLFAKLTIFTWLMFVEIAFHLRQTAKEGEKETAELVFLEIAGLVCRQLKEIAWRNALSDEVLLELEKRKLL